MSDKRRIRLDGAKSLALEVAELLRPACERLEIAGSIRRGGDSFGTVGDLELLCVPKVERGEDLFGSAAAGPEWNELDALAGDLRLRGVFGDRPDKNGRPAWGSRYKRALYKGVGLDLFSVLPPAQWGCLFAIRTGPRWFSKALVVPRNKTVYSDDGRPLCAGLMPTWLRHEDGHYSHATDGQAYSTPEESDVFVLLGLDYIPPQERDAFITVRVAAGVGR